jgi:hypothetical protein
MRRFSGAGAGVSLGSGGEEGVGGEGGAVSMLSMPRL